VSRTSFFKILWRGLAAFIFMSSGSRADNGTSELRAVPPFATLTDRDFISTGVLPDFRSIAAGGVALADAPCPNEPSKYGNPPPNCIINPNKVGGPKVAQTDNEYILFGQLDFLSALGTVSLEDSLQVEGKTGRGRPRNLAAKPWIYYAYLAEQGTWYAQEVFGFTEEDRRLYQAGVLTNTPHESADALTTLLEYGITDDLSMGAEITEISRSRDPNPVDPSPTNGATQHNQAWSNPTLFAAYRVLRQEVDSPVTLFVRGSYTPRDVVGNGGTLVDLGALIVREEGDFVFSGGFDALGVLATATQDGGNAGHFWTYGVNFQGSTHLSEQWLVGLGAGYEFAAERADNRNSPPYSKSQINIDGVPWMSVGVSYVVIPDQLALTFSYEHDFAYGIDAPSFPTRSENTVTRATSIEGRNIFEIGVRGVLPPD
jgi:hypothetical protein